CSPRSGVSPRWLEPRTPPARRRAALGSRRKEPEPAPSRGRETAPSAARTPGARPHLQRSPAQTAQELGRLDLPSRSLPLLSGPWGFPPARGGGGARGPHPPLVALFERSVRPRRRAAAHRASPAAIAAEGRDMRRAAPPHTAAPDDKPSH